MRGIQLTKVILTGAALMALAALEINEEIKKQRNKTDSKDENPSDAEMIAAQGRALLTKPVELDQSLNQYVQQQYLGLYLIGRVGLQLSDKELGSLAKTLQHLHGQLDKPIDWALVSWYQVVGVGQNIPLRRLLQACPDATMLGGKPEYIAFALRQPGALSFDGYKEDINALMKQ